MRSLTRSPSPGRPRQPPMSGGGRFRRGRGSYYQRSPPSPFLTRRYTSGNVQQQRKRRRFSRSPHSNRSTLRRRSRDRRLSRSPVSSSSYHHGSNKESGDYRNYGNRTWHRPPASALTTTVDTTTHVPQVATSILTSQVEEKSTSAATTTTTRWDSKNEDNKISEDPSIEEIDEIINKAQKERRQEIIKRDKEILKKAAEGGSF